MAILGAVHEFRNGKGGGEGGCALCYGLVSERRSGGGQGRGPGEGARGGDSKK